MEIKNAIIVFADISGYTDFLRLHTMSLLHAEKIVTDLLNAVIDEVESPLKLNKLEGDALLLYAEVDENAAEAAGQVMAQVTRFFDAFTQRSQRLTGCNNLCPCDACREAKQLRLKVILHSGPVAVKQVRQFEEVAGESVIAAHLLAKNTVPSDEYILTTKEFKELAAGPAEWRREERREECGQIGAMDVEVHYPPASSSAEPEGPEAPRKVWSTVLNAVKLDTYGLARTLGMKKAPARTDREEARGKPGFRAFLGDMILGLGMVIRGK
jgi:hypothetical protein